MKLRIKRVDPALPLPTRGSRGAAGLDLITREDTTVPPGGIALVPANTIVQVPPGYMLIVAARSSTPKRTGLVAPHGFGVIDSDYRGDGDEIRVQVWNPGGEPVTVRRGDRIAQAILVRIEPVDWAETDGELGPTRGGFGSTG